MRKGWQPRHMVHEGQACVKYGEKELGGRSAALFVVAVHVAAERYPDTGLEIVWDRKKRRSYSRTVADFKHLTIVPITCTVKWSAQPSDYKIVDGESFMATTDDGKKIVCSPV